MWQLKPSGGPRIALHAGAPGHPTVKSNENGRPKERVLTSEACRSTDGDVSAT